MAGGLARLQGRQRLGGLSAALLLLLFLTLACDSCHLCIVGVSMLTAATVDVVQSLLLFL